MKSHKNMIDPKKLLQANQIKEELLKRYKRFNQLDLIGYGNWGYAYKCGERVVKVTYDNQEAKVAAHLKGHKNKYIANIYRLSQFKSKSQDRTYTIIEMELLYADEDQRLRIKHALSDFKTVWFSRYDETLRINFDLWKLCEVYRNNDYATLSKVRKMLEEDLTAQNEMYETYHMCDKDKRKEQSLDFFDFIESAYKELLSKYDNARIDLNEGNFMYDAKGILKCFDIQQYDYTKT